MRVLALLAALVGLSACAPNMSPETAADLRCIGATGVYAASKAGGAWNLEQQRAIAQEICE